MNTRFKKKLSIFARQNLNKSKDKPSKKSQAQAKMLKLLSRQWGINSITKVERFRLFTLLLRSEELQLALLLLITFEDKLLSGKCGIAILKNLRNKTKTTKKRRNKMRKNKKKPQTILDNQEDIQLHLKDVWRSCKEWLDKTKKTRNIMTIGTIGKKERKLNHLKDNYFLFGVLVMRRRKSMLPRFHGTLNIKISSLYHWAAMISLNRKQVKYWFGL